MQASFVSFVYIAALAAPLFTVTTLALTAAAGIDEVLDIIEIPDLSDVVDLGIFDFATDALDAVVDLLETAIRGILYVFLVIFFDQFFTAVKSQFLGSFTSIFFLVSNSINFRYLYITIIEYQVLQD